MIGTNSTKTAKQIVCANCGEPTTANKRIATDHKIYCTKLCAGLGLIRSAYDEDGIDPDLASDTLATLVERSLCEDPVPIPTRVRDCDAEAALELLYSGPLGDRRFMIVVGDESTPDWVPDPRRQHMAKKNYKFGLPQGKVLQFTPTGKSVPVPAQEIADDQLLQAHYPHMFIEPRLRGLFLAGIKGGDEGTQKYLRERVSEDYSPSAS
jgi:hypothetical protein